MGFYTCTDKRLVPVVQRTDNANQRINHYSVDIVVVFVDIRPLDRNLSGWQRCPSFEQSISGGMPYKNV